MNRTELVHMIGELLLRCKKVKQNPWQSLSLVYDTDEGHTANSGFLYQEGNTRPFSARIEDSPTLLRDTVLDLRQVIYEETGKQITQLLIQMESESGKLKIDFDFEKPGKWSIEPSNFKQMRESLRPSFED